MTGMARLCWLCLVFTDVLQRLVTNRQRVFIASRISVVPAVVAVVVHVGLLN